MSRIADDHEEKSKLWVPNTTVKLVVPHPRDLRVGSRGYDVEALQRALSKAGLRKWGGFTTNYGKGCFDEVRTFQQHHKLHVDGIYGTATHKKLGPYYDAFGIRLINRVHISTPAEIRRSHLLSAAQILYNRGSIVHYTQGPLRMWIVRNRYNLARLGTMSQDYEDCSSGVTGLRYVSDLSDPNQLNYDGQGFTGTLGDHGVNVARGQEKIGDFYLYGLAPYYHVTMNVGVNRAWSQGGEYGPNLIEPFYAYVGDIRRYPGLP